MNNRQKLNESIALISQVERSMLNLPLPIGVSRRPVIALERDATQRALRALRELITKEIAKIDKANAAK